VTSGANFKLQLLLTSADLATFGSSLVTDDAVAAIVESSELEASDASLQRGIAAGQTLVFQGTVHRQNYTPLE